MISDPSYLLEHHNVSLRYGFLPDNPPLQRLPHVYYQPWESFMDALPDLITHRQVRATVDRIPILNTSELSSEQEWMRAYCVLSFMTHAYIWGDNVPSQTLPPTICCPYLEIAEHFGLPSTATYSAFNLWNWAPLQPGADVTSPENIRMLHTFTGTPDEEWFYLISVAIEAEGAKLIPLMLECFEAVRTDSNQQIARLLQSISNCITKLGKILDRMHERCSPAVFYHRIRPFLAGSKGMAGAGLPHGVFYEEGEGRGSWRQYSGGSNAQSSLIQLMDIMLGVEHYATDKRSPPMKEPGVRSKHGYIEEMRRYMPSRHKIFLQHVARTANIRSCAMSYDADPAVRDAYATAVNSLTTFRDKHINIVARYIIAPSRKPTSVYSTVNIATSSSQLLTEKKTELCGTGGTHLIPFLRQTRDETKQASAMPDVLLV